MDELGWDSCDVIIVTGDAYVDHPSFGMAIVGRVLEAQGFRVGIIAQPDWRSTEDFMKLGRPGLFFGVTGGNMEPLKARMDFEFDPLPEGFGATVTELVNAEIQADRPIEISFLPRADALVIAHEAGHMMHSAYSSKVQPFPTSRSKHIHASAIRKVQVAHIFNDTENRHVHLAEHLQAAPGIVQRDQLRQRHDHTTGD